MTCDSAYMGELLAMVARTVWLINIVGTSQTNRCGADSSLVKAAKQEMKRGSYECKFFCHRYLALCLALWADNNVVTTLANCYPPTLCTAGNGVNRRMRGDDGKREKHPTPVKIPLQTKWYTDTFGIIDDKNGKDAVFDLKGESHCHNWSPKINKRYYNIHSGNAGTFYERACFLYTPDKRTLRPKEQMADLAHYLCTLGESMRSYVPRHPSILRDLSRVFASGAGRKIRSDARGIARGPVTAAAIMAKVARAKCLRYKQQHRSPWRQHQSMACERRGYCENTECPGQGQARWRARETNMRCEECSEMLGRNVFLCNGTRGLVDGEVRKWKVICCHQEYHDSLFSKK